MHGITRSTGRQTQPAHQNCQIHPKLHCYARKRFNKKCSNFSIPSKSNVRSHSISESLLLGFLFLPPSVQAFALGQLGCLLWRHGNLFFGRCLGWQAEWSLLLLLCKGRRCFVLWSRSLEELAKTLVVWQNWSDNQLDLWFGVHSRQFVDRDCQCFGVWEECPVDCGNLVGLDRHVDIRVVSGGCGFGRCVSVVRRSGRKT